MLAGSFKSFNEIVMLHRQQQVAPDCLNVCVLQHGRRRAQDGRCSLSLSGEQAGALINHQIIRTAHLDDERAFAGKMP